MIWKPNTRDLETIAELGHARAAAGRIAAALGITPEEFSAWADRLVAARTLDVAGLYRKPMPKPPKRVTPQIVADRRRLHDRGLNLRDMLDGAPPTMLMRSY